MIVFEIEQQIGIKQEAALSRYSQLRKSNFRKIMPKLSRDESFIICDETNDDTKFVKDAYQNIEPQLSDYTSN
jgi:hypothetical protein